MKTLWKWMMLGLVLLAGSGVVSLVATGDSAISWAQGDSKIVATAASSTELASSPESRDAVATVALPANASVVGFGHVDVDGGTTPLAVPTIGQVTEVLVREGQRVKAGEPLLQLDNASARAAVAQAESAVREASVRLAQSRRAPANHELKRSQQNEAVAVAKARVQAQEREVAKLQPLSRTQVVSGVDYSRAKDRLDEFQAALNVEQFKLEQLELEDPQEMISLAQAALEAATAQRELAREALQRHTLHAPDNGTILRVLVSKGQMLGANQTQPPIWFCPDRPHIVRCEIDQEFASRVEPGMEADLYDESTDHHWKGTVERCADWIAPRRSMLDEPFQRNDVRTLECMISLDPNQPPTRIGQRLRVVLTPKKQSR